MKYADDGRSQCCSMFSRLVQVSASLAAEPSDLVASCLMHYVKDYSVESTLSLH